jgi:hypothetical protein
VAAVMGVAATPGVETVLAVPTQRVVAAVAAVQKPSKVVHVTPLAAERADMDTNDQRRVRLNASSLHARVGTPPPPSVWSCCKAALTSSFQHRACGHAPPDGEALDGLLHGAIKR